MHTSQALTCEGKLGVRRHELVHAVAQTVKHVGKEE